MLSVQWGIESSTGSFGYGNDLFKARIAASFTGKRQCAAPNPETSDPI